MPRRWKGEIVAPPTSKRGGRYAVTYDYTAAKLGIHRPYLPAENRIVKALIEAALESGMSHSDAVRLGIATYKEIDLLARDEKSNILSRTALKDIRVYCRAILRSGSTFSAFEVATRAVAAWRLTLQELKTLHEEWDRESATKRLKQRKSRQEKQEAAQIVKAQVSQPLLGAEDIDTDVDVNVDSSVDGVGDLYDDFPDLQRLDYEVDRHG